MSDKAVTQWEDILPEKIDKSLSGESVPLREHNLTNLGPLDKILPGLLKKEWAQ